MSPQPTPSTAPRDRRALSNLKHGITGRIYLFNAEEEAAYNNLCVSLHEEYSPQSPTERELVQQLCDSRWRLGRVASAESAIFAQYAETFANSAEATGDPLLDQALSQGRAWQAEAKQLNLLGLYESRVNRQSERTLKQLREIQSERKATLQSAIEEATLLAHAAKSTGEAYDPATAFTARGFEFSAEEISRMTTRCRRIWEAQNLFKSAARAQKSHLRAA